MDGNDGGVVSGAVVVLLQQIVQFHFFMHS